jgi:fructose-bisphosphate aldolase class I
MADLAAVASALAAPGRGILASDESTATIGKRFDKYGLPNEEVWRVES